MTTKTARIGNAGGEGRMCVLRIVTDMAGQATATAVPHYVVTVFFLCLADMTAGALLAQHRICGAVTESLQVSRVFRAGRLIK